MEKEAHEVEEACQAEAVHKVAEKTRRAVEVYKAAEEVIRMKKEACHKVAEKAAKK